MRSDKLPAKETSRKEELFYRTAKNFHFLIFRVFSLLFRFRVRRPPLFNKTHFLCVHVLVHCTTRVTCRCFGIKRGDLR